MVKNSEYGRLIQAAFFSCIFLCVGCGKKDVRLQTPAQQQAKAIDFMAPLGFVSVQSSISTNPVDYAHYARYRGHGFVKDILVFYKRELDRLGWDISDVSSKDKGVLVCKKAYKTGVVFIQQSTKTTVIIDYFERLKES